MAATIPAYLAKSGYYDFLYPGEIVHITEDQIVGKATSSKITNIPGMTSVFIELKGSNNPAVAWVPKEHHNG